MCSTAGDTHTHTSTCRALIWGRGLWKSLLNWEAASDCLTTVLSVATVPELFQVLFLDSFLSTREQLSHVWRKRRLGFCWAEVTFYSHAVRFWSLLRSFQGPLCVCVKGVFIAPRAKGDASRIFLGSDNRIYLQERKDQPHFIQFLWENPTKMWLEKIWRRRFRR